MEPPQVVVAALLLCWRVDRVDAYAARVEAARQAADRAA